MRVNKMMSFFSGSSLKKPYLLVFITPAQSNAGTIDDGTAQNTGRVPYANMPTRLQTPPSNIDFVKQVGSSGFIAPMEVVVTNQWGWLNQFLYVISPLWDDIIYCKKSLGGSDILPGGLGSYPRGNFEARATIAITEADSRWGAGNYNVLYICDIGETNAATATNADAWLPAMQEWVDDNLRVNFKDGPIIVIKKGKYQDLDFPFIISNLWAAQDAYIALNPSTNKIAEGSGALYQLKDQSDDFSHYNNAGAITMGNIVAEEAIDIFGISKSDSTIPTLVSAVVENSSPSNVVLTYDKNLDEYVLPFWKDFTFNSQRKITNVSISGTVVTLTASEPFYTGQTIQLTYTKKQYYENTICDPYGNEADALVSQVVTNNVLTAVPIVTNSYTSNFSAGVDGWGPASATCTVLPVDGILGENDVLEITAVTTSITAFRSTTLVNGGLYRIRYKMYVPTLMLVGGTYHVDYNIQMIHGIAGTLSGNMYQYTRRNVVTGWVDYEFTFVAGATGQLRFQNASVTIGEKFYVKDIVLDRLT